MAAAELSSDTHEAPVRSEATGWLRPFARAYAATWAATLGGAVLVALAGPTVRDQARSLLGLELVAGHTPTPSIGHVLALFAHNLPIAAWPLLLGVCAGGRSRTTVLLTDVLLGSCLLASTLPVGAAFGAYGSALVAYVPQLPLEWAALALGVSSWLIGRDRPLERRERVLGLAAIATLLLAAAAIESYAVPRR